MAVGRRKARRRVQHRARDDPYTRGAGLTFLESSANSSSCGAVAPWPGRVAPPPQAVHARGAIWAHGATEACGVGRPWRVGRIRRPPQGAERRAVKAPRVPYGAPTDVAHGRVRAVPGGERDQKTARCRSALGPSGMKAGPGGPSAHASGAYRRQAGQSGPGAASTRTGRPADHGEGMQTAAPRREFTAATPVLARRRVDGCRGGAPFGELWRFEAVRRRTTARPNGNRRPGIGQDPAGPGRPRGGRWASLCRARRDVLRRAPGGPRREAPGPACANDRRTAASATAGRVPPAALPPSVPCP